MQAWIHHVPLFFLIAAIPMENYHETVAYELLWDCRQHYFQQPDRFHVDGRLYEHCGYHKEKLYSHNNYKL